MSNQPNTSQPTTIIVKSQKSIGVSLLLTFLFGPLGMFYSTTSGALIMLVISVILGIITVGIGILFTWPVCMIWGAIAANNHNKSLGA